MKSGQNNTNKYPRVISFLGVGKENGINQANLCEMMECDPTELKAAVQSFRRKNKNPGLFICSDSHGYYIAKNRQEIKEFAAREEKQAKSRFKTIREAKRMLEETEGQVNIDELGV